MASNPHSQTAPAADDPQDASAIGYRTVSLGAVFGLLLGAASVLALLGPAMWMVPAVGVLVNVRALQAMAKAEAMQVGRWMAYLGLFLSVMFGVAAPAEIWGNRWFLERSARPAAEAWFAALRQGEPEKALQLKVSAGLRLPADKKLPEYYRANGKAHQELESFVEDPLVKTLLLLGTRAQTRWYETSGLAAEEGHDILSQVYAVTFDDAGTKTTFFVAVKMERTIDFSGQSRWRLASAQGGVRRQAGWNDRLPAVSSVAPTDMTHG